MLLHFTCCCLNLSPLCPCCVFKALYGLVRQGGREGAGGAKGSLGKYQPLQCLSVLWPQIGALKGEKEEPSIYSKILQPLGWLDRWMEVERAALL